MNITSFLRIVILLLSFTRSIISTKYIYDVLKNRNVNPSFQQTYFLKAFKISSNLRCISECEKLNNCFSTAFSSQQNCVLFSKIITNASDETYVMDYVTLSNKKLATINESCVRTECNYGELLSCSSKSVCTCEANSIQKSWCAEKSICARPPGTINSPCMWNCECDTFKGLICLNSICSCQNSSFYWNNTCLWIPITTYLVADAQTTWGTWGPQQECPNRRTVIGYQLKVEDACGACDDTSLNGIILKCDDGSTISSSQHTYGVFKNWQYCPTGSVIIGFSFRSEPYQGVFTDDSAGNDLQMKCNDSTILTNSGGGTLGNFGSWFTCSIGHICGIQTLIDTSTLDNTALNSVQFTCCFP